MFLVDSNIDKHIVVVLMQCIKLFILAKMLFVKFDNIMCVLWLLHRRSQDIRCGSAFYFCLI